MPKQKLRAIDDLRTRYNPLCKVEAFKTEEETSSIGVSRSGDDLSNASRAASVSKVIGVSSRPYLPARTRKSRRLACASSEASTNTLPGATLTWDDFAEEAPDPDITSSNQGLMAGGAGHTNVTSSPSILNPSVTEYGFFYTHLWESSNPHSLYSGVYGSQTLDQWYLFTLTRENSIVRMYVNGVLVSQLVNIGANVNGQHLLFAGGIELSSPSYGYNELVLNGKLDQITGWDRAITPAEVSSLYNDGEGIAHSAMPASLTNGMAECFEFPDAVGIDVADRGTGSSWIWHTNRTFENLQNDDGTAYTGERVNGAGPSLGVTGPNDYSNFTFSQPGGKVSQNAFTPAWIDSGVTHGTDPNTGLPWTGTDLALEYSPHASRKALLKMDNTIIDPLNSSDEYSVSSWVSRRGMPVGRNPWAKLTGFTGAAGPSAIFAGYANIFDGTIECLMKPNSYELSSSYWAWNL